MLHSAKDNPNQNGTGGNVVITPPSSKAKVETYAGKTIVNSISGPGSMCLDKNGFLYVAETAGDNNILYVSDYGNDVIRKITFPKQ